jgi:hypothetical protein
MSDDVTYRYALDSKTKQFIDVEDLEKKDRERKFICLDCGAIVTPFMGEVQQRHFRHKPDNKLGCSGESQLHFSTKTAFFELYNDAVKEELEFIIEYNVEKVCNRYEADNLTPCSLGISVVSSELTKDYPKIAMEKRVDRFIPDLVLFSDNHEEKIFVEIAFTHESTEEKKKSKYKIIEIKIDYRVNTELFQERVISEGDRIDFYNFQKVLKESFCKDDCFELQATWPNNEVEHNEIEHNDIEITETFLKNPVLEMLNNEGFDRSSLISRLASSDFFIVYKNHESRIVRVTVDELIQQERSISYTEFITFPDDFPHDLTRAKDRLYEGRIIESLKKGYKVDNCFLCQYRKEEYINDLAGYIYCDFLYGCFDSNKAVSCSNYKINSVKIESGQDTLSKDNLKINDLVEYIGGAIKYRNGAGEIIEASHGFYKCDFNGELTEWLSRRELSLIE